MQHQIWANYLYISYKAGALTCQTCFYIRLDSSVGVLYTVQRPSLGDKSHINLVPLYVHFLAYSIVVCNYKVTYYMEVEEAVVFVSSFLKFLLKRVLGKMSIKEASFIPFRKKKERGTWTVFEITKKRQKYLFKLLFSYRYLKSTHIRQIPCLIKPNSSQLKPSAPTALDGVSLSISCLIFLTVKIRNPNVKFNMKKKNGINRLSFDFPCCCLLLLPQNKIFSSFFSHDVLHSLLSSPSFYFQLSSARHTYLTIAINALYKHSPHAAIYGAVADASVMVLQSSRHFNQIDWHDFNSLPPLPSYIQSAKPLLFFAR